ncbi:Phenylalanyl-tRNA synthetase beta chain [Lunatimonas lonarensis]|uniref:Phenylalanine--tRNA ligase beta subunit n=1 Tax=Lunatimonas lonarensis TaxID=1232681 RepID=R7ZP09_9BACT|nr:phenylalanine--tRNA ligase subunit beta [Lunatimonas lonarensis]EON75845.1 Phenylalanyl-tRNA synthetase beta chain [Lunatimonas lonarensis]
MNISLHRLKEYLSFDQSPEEIAALLTASGLEVEGISTFESIPGSLEGVVIGEVLTCAPHPNADKLRVTTVSIGEEVVPIVCGAPNVAAGQKVAVATVGATLYTSSGESFQIKKAKIRGEVSEGMICAEDELGLGDNHDGILVLETDLANGTPASEYFGIFRTDVLEIGLTPNRADAASHMGVARDLSALLRKPLRLPSVEHFAVDNEALPIEVEVEDANDCPRYAGLTLTGLKVGPSPEWLQNYLKAIDLEPINNVVDVTNFILHDLGQPLHAFDASKIKGGKIIVKRLPKGTSFTTLDEKERKLSGAELMICDEGQGLCIAGIFGGLGSGISEQTTEVFLESACFSPDIIRKGSQYHGLKTDASFRFERGTDPNMPVYALKRAAMLIKELAGGNISSSIVDVYPNPIQDVRIWVKYRNVTRLIGKEISKDEIHDILRSLEIGIEGETGEGFFAIVKPYRVDVTREADIIEEVLRIYGFDAIPLSDTYQADFLANHPEKDGNRIQYRISEILSARGFYEIITNSLTKPSYAEQSPHLDGKDSVIVLNKLSEDLGVLRQSLVHTGLEVLAYNINRRQKDLACFEFGTVYRNSVKGYAERKHLSLFLTGNATSESWLAPVSPVQFSQLYAVVEALLLKLHVGTPTVEMAEEGDFEYGLKLLLGKAPVARIGLLSDTVTRMAEIKQDVFYAELDWTALLEATEGVRKFAEISKFPEVRRDLSLVIDKSVSFATLKELAEKAGGPLLRRVGVFDVYTGDKIDASKKAYALSFFLQDFEKTLTDKVIDKTMTRLMQVFEKEADAYIRK